MNYYKYVSNKKKQLESYERYFPYCYNSIEAVMLTDQISKLKSEIRVLENITLAQSQQEIKTEAVYFESKINAN